MGGKHNQVLVGQEFGKLTAISLVGKCDNGGHRIWKCQCVCGNAIEVSQTRLKSGNTKSCGCVKLKRANDLVGERFGRLTVLEVTEKRIYGCAVLKCVCDCGNFTMVRSSSLRDGSTKSCGCRRIENSKEALCKKAQSRGLSTVAFNSLLHGYIRNAKKRGLVFEIEKEDFRIITSKDCVYCGKPPMQVSRVTYAYGDYIYNGIDRIDNSKGYIIENCVPCCGRCNEAKMDQSKQEFLDWIKRDYEYNKLGEL